jgi:hypothetical protein
MAWLVLLVAAGCAHHGVNAPQAQTGRAFVNALKALPPGQRAAYAQQHPEGVSAVMASRDKQLYVDYNSTIRYPH